MSTFSPVPAYLAGALCISLGVNGMVHPEADSPRFGLPLDGASETGTVSPLIYVKGMRETTYGFVLVALHTRTKKQPITTVAAVISLVGLSDGLVVWRYGGNRRTKAWNHWGAFLIFAAWSW
jgi:hypothetical protein